MNEAQEKVTDNLQEEIKFEEVNDSGFEVEIVEDAKPEEKPRTEATDESNIPDDQEIASYSKDVQKRINKLKFEYHEEKRRKEEASRLQDEAISYAKRLSDENQKLRKALDDGEGVLLDQAKGRVDAELDKAKAAYKAAYETGDPDALISAQEKMTQLQNEKYRVDSFKPQKRQDNVPPPVAQPADTQQTPQVQKPDDKALEWSKKNEWFGKDSEMTGYAFGVHERLVKEGLHTSGDEYYQKIDEAMRKTFPDKFDVQEIEEEAPVRQTGSVVAPQSRSAKKPRKVQLTSSAVKLCKRMGITPEQYAAQVLKESSDVR
tara:strand:+ start:1581 stop:2534 length:954 start_codon:yes stop_codon:yes gene_type:complete